MEKFILMKDKESGAMDYYVYCRAIMENSDLEEATPLQKIEWIEKQSGWDDVVFSIVEDVINDAGIEYDESEDIDYDELYQQAATVIKQKYQ